MTIDFSALLSYLGILGGGTGVAAIIVAINSRRKTKADTLSVIEAAATASVIRTREEADRARREADRESEEASKWRDECCKLRNDLRELSGRVEENNVCQGNLTRAMTIQQEELDFLKEEKIKLSNRIVELESKLNELQEENKRLKEQRHIEKELINQ